MRTPRAGAAVLAGALWLSPALAQSQPSAVSEDQLLESSIKQAKAQIAAGDIAEALRTLQAAYQRVPTPALLWPLAELHMRLQQPREGLRRLDQYVSQVRADRMPPGQRLPDVERMRGQLRAQFATLQLSGVRAGSAVLVDDVEVAQTPLSEPLALDPGRHQLEVRSVMALRSQVQLMPGQVLQLNLAPDELRPQPKASRGPNKAQYALAGLGLAAVAAGAVLWGLDGYQSCPQAPMCATELDGKLPGVALVSVGAGLTAGALSWWLHDLVMRARASQ